MSFLARLIILSMVSFAIKVYGLDDGIYTWRQADTASMARNFYRCGMTLWRPMIDWGGASPFVVESEFPLYQYIVALAYMVTGVDESVGKLMSIFFSIFTAISLAFIARNAAGEQCGLWTAAAYSFFPFTLHFSRLFMPDTMMMFFAVTSVLFMQIWSRGGNRSCFYASAACASLACALKLTALYIGLPLLCIIYEKEGRDFYIKSENWIYAVIVILPVAAWYSHAAALRLESGLTFGIWDYGSGKWGNWGIAFSASYLSILAIRFLQFTAFGGVLLAGSGVVMKIFNGGSRIFEMWGLAVAAYLIIVAKGNIVHAYYQYPLMPPAAIFSGYFCSRIFNGSVAAARLYVLRIGAAACIMVAAVSFLFIYGSYDAVESRRERIGVVTAAAMINRLTGPGEPVVSIGRGDPTLLYLSDRRGWLSSWRDLLDGRCDTFKTRGAKYAAGLYSDIDQVDVQTFRNAAGKKKNFLFDDGLAFVIEL